MKIQKFPLGIAIISLQSKKNNHLTIAKKQ